ncbi:MAG: hypothetical protein CSA75_01170 [Sorangium cellulosum]|nr:MAG: hypothetical protein CSA75_01170 [Sorangium cellulosum]
MAGTECQGKSCCSNILVPGGTFPMGCTMDENCYSDEFPEHDATVADFYLDEYETTVGRFRQFVQQYDGTPLLDGAGAHPLISGSGWQAEWNSQLPSSQFELISNLKCHSSYQTWTDAPGSNEAYPVNCVSWFEAFAFCAWDGGRLPTEAEWEYASAGGGENRRYPWGQQEPDATRSNFYGSDHSPFIDVGSHPVGGGRWGHRDLAGSMWEWTLDWYSSLWYSGAGNSCDHCANITNESRRVRRGGSWNSSATYLRTTNRRSRTPVNHSHYIGFRCARTP